MTIYINTSPVTEVVQLFIALKFLMRFYDIFMSHHIKDYNDDDTDNNILLKTNSSLRGFCINTDQ